MESSSEISDTSHERSLQAWSDLRRHQILLDADEFVTKYDLDDLRNEIRTGALLLEDPDHVEGLTDADVSALAEEKRPIPIFSNKLMKELPHICYIGVMLWGFVEAPLSMSAPGQARRGGMLKRPLMIFDTFVELEPAYWVLGFWCAIPLLRYFGRRGAVYGAVSLRLAGVLYAMISPEFSSNRVSGSLYAITKGMFQCTMPMYLAETSPIPARGSILLTWKLAQGFGMSFGAFVFTTSSPIAALLLLGVGLCFWMSPESPYWHFYRGEMRQAYKGLLKRRKVAAQASRDLYRMYSFRTYDRRVSDNARRTKRYLLPALAITTTLVLSWTVPGILGALILISLSKMPPSNYGAPTLVIMVLSTVFSVIMIPLVERIGRRRSVLTGMAIMAFTLVVNMLSPYTYRWGFTPWELGIPQTVMLPFAPLLIILELYAAEIACSFGSDALMAVFLTICVLRDISAAYLATIIIKRDSTFVMWNLSAVAPLLLFLALHLIFIFLICVLLIETKGRSLEEIRSAFDFPIANRVAYRVHLYSSYITRRASSPRREDLEPFEEFEYGNGMIRLQEGNIG